MIVFFALLSNINLTPRIAKYQINSSCTKAKKYLNM